MSELMQEIKRESRDCLVIVILLIAFLVWVLLTAAKERELVYYKTWCLATDYIGWVHYVNDVPYHFDRKVEKEAL